MDRAIFLLGLAVVLAAGVIALVMVVAGAYLDGCLPLPDADDLPSRDGAEAERAQLARDHLHEVWEADARGELTDDWERSARTLRRIK